MGCRRLAVDDDHRGRARPRGLRRLDEVGGHDQRRARRCRRAGGEALRAEELAQRQRHGSRLGDRELGDRGREALRGRAVRPSRRGRRRARRARSRGGSRPRPARRTSCPSRPQLLLDHRRVARDLLVRAGDPDVEASGIRHRNARRPAVRPAGRHDRRSTGSHVNRARRAPASPLEDAREERHEDVRQRADRHQVGERDDTHRPAEQPAEERAPPPR